MPINYYCAIAMNGSDIEMNKNQLQLPVIDNEATAPASPVEGQMYFDTTAGDKTMYFYNGTAWIEMDGSGSGVESFTNANGTYISASTVNTAATGAVTVGTIDLSAADGTDSSGRFLSKDNVWSTIPGGYSSWTINGDTSTGTNTVSNNQTVTITGGKGIVTEVSNRDVNVDFTPSELNTVTPLSTDKVVITDTSDSNNPKLVLISDIVDLGVKTVKTTDGTYIDLTPTTATSGAVTVTADLSAVDGTSSTTTKFLSKDNTWDVPSYTANTNETYTLPVSAGTAVTGYSVADIDLTAGGTGSGIKSKVTFAGKDLNVEITETIGNNGIVKIGLPDNVTIPFVFSSGSISTGAISGAVATLTGASLSGVIDMNSNQINELADGTLSTDAVNLGQVETLISGTSAFQGGYDAANNTPDLDTSPATSIQQGYFWAVTDAGTFFAETVQPGDLIFADQDNPGATFSNWTVVQSGQETAGEGASDGVTTKGIAGFDSATFSVTANGFVTSDIYGGASTLGVVPSGGGGTTFLRGDGTWAVPANDNTQRAAGVGLSLNGNTIDANVNATVQTVAKQGVSATAARTYEIQVDSSDQLVVNVPWADTNTNLVTSVSQGTSGTSTGLTNAIEVSPTTGNVEVIANKYDGGNNVGYVPNGGSSTTFLRGDGTWVTPTDSTPVDSVTAGLLDEELGIVVFPTTGAVKVGLDIKGLDDMNVVASSDRIPIYDDSDEQNKYVTVANLAAATHDVNSYAATITGFGTVTHNLGSYDVIVQLYNATNYETVYACVDRTSTNVVGISGNSFPAGNIRVLVSKVIA